MTPQAFLTVLASDDSITKHRKAKERAWTLVAKCSLAQIFEAGTPVNYLLTSNIQNKAALALIVRSKLKHVVQYIDAKKTIKSDYDLGLTVNAIIKQCGSWYVEEIVQVLHHIVEGKFGKMYERFQALEIIEILKTYEEKERSDFLADLHGRHKEDPGETVTVDFTEIKTFNGKSLTEVWSDIQKKTRNDKLEELIDKTNRVLSGRIKAKTLDVIEEAGNVQAKAEEIFEKIAKGQDLTFDDERFCERHSIPVIKRILNQTQREKARDYGMSSDELNEKMRSRVNEKLEKEKTLTPYEEQYANRNRLIK